MRSRAIYALPLALVVSVPSVLTAQAGEPVRAQLRNGTQADTTTALALSSAFRAAAERTLPAVVFINVEQMAPPARQEPFEIPEEFRRMLPPGFTPRQQPDRPQRGTGSGFIIDAQGHILTNTHVVADASRLTVRLVDGREFAARVIGTDISTDIAVIKIDVQGQSLPIAPLGDSQALRVGDWVLALGSPLGLDFTVTAGIVSAMGRQISTIADGLESFIQTDAVINPGNSGGPLIDLFGRVVGVNSAIFGSDRFVGYGFAVPISLARRVSADLLEHGYLRRPMLGASILSVGAVDAEIYNLREIRGVLVSGVTPDGPAARAGLRAGDVVLALDGRPVRDNTELLTGLAERRPGQRVTLEVHRGGRTTNVQVELSEFPRPPQAEAAATQVTGRRPHVLGFSVRDLTPADAQRAGFAGEGGVIVEREMQSDSPVREGAIILAVNEQRVRSSEQFARLAERIDPGSAVSLRVFHRDYGELVVNYRTRP